MPELPEVETIVRCLRRRLIGLEVENVRVVFRAVVRNRKASFLKRLIGQEIVGLRRRGKMALLDFSGGLTLIVPLQMTGQVFCCGWGAPFDQDKQFYLFLT